TVRVCLFRHSREQRVEVSTGGAMQPTTRPDVTLTPGVPAPTSAAGGPGRHRRAQEGRDVVGVLDRFEKGIERAVNGVFARAFRSEVQPVELASGLKREADDNASVVGRNRTIAPNDYVVELGPADHRRLGQWEDALGDELATVLNDHALEKRYAFGGQVHVRFERAEDLDTGVFRVRSRTFRDGDHGAHDGADSSREAGGPRPYPGAP